VTSSKYVGTLAAILGEIRKGILVSWTYRTNLLSAMLTLGFILFAMISMVGGNQSDIDQVHSILVGYLTWMYVSFAIRNMGQSLRGEIQAGTLEQMAMSPSSLDLLLCARVVANSIVTTALVVLVNAATSIFFGVQLPLRWQGIPVMLLTLLGVLGFGYGIAGATLVFREATSFANLAQNVLLFLNGTVVPLQAMPGELAILARTLPSTQGILVLRQVLLDGRSLVAVWQNGSLVWLAVHSLAYLVVGWLIFALCKRMAKTQGTLGQY
jgi:ABC-2 type transport system permease protein